MGRQGDNKGRGRLGRRGLRLRMGWLSEGLIAGMIAGMLAGSEHRIVHRNGRWIGAQGVHRNGHRIEAQECSPECSQDRSIGSFTGTVTVSKRRSFTGTVVGSERRAFAGPCTIAGTTLPLRSSAIRLADIRLRAVAPIRACFA